MGTATITGAMPSSTASMEMGGMDMGGGGGNACKISVGELRVVRVLQLTVDCRCCGIGIPSILVSRCQ